MINKVCMLVVARNELENIKLVYKRLEEVAIQCGVDFLYIDGNSTDGTIDFFRIKNIPYVQQKYPGRGGAIRTGLELPGYDAYIVYSPDGNENIEDLPLFIEKLNSGAELVIASRMMDGAWNEEDSQRIKLRKWANNAFNLIANLAFNKGDYITDSINGYRAVTKKALNIISLTAFDYTIEYQMTMRSMKKGLKIVEFPTVEGNRVYGVTGAPSIPTGIAFIKRFALEYFNRS
jgi:hypothetical protein